MAGETKRTDRLTELKEMTPDELRARRGTVQEGVYVDCGRRPVEDDPPRLQPHRHRELSQAIHRLSQAVAAVLDSRARPHPRHEVIPRDPRGGGRRDQQEQRKVHLRLGGDPGQRRLEDTLAKREGTQHEHAPRGQHHRSREELLPPRSLSASHARHAGLVNRPTGRSARMARATTTCDIKTPSPFGLSRARRRCVISAS